MRIALLLAAAALLVAGLYAAAVRGLADVHDYAARGTLDALERAGRLPDARERAHIEAALARARALEPSNPLFVEQAARVADMRARDRSIDVAGRVAALRRSLEEFRRAAVMRPGSPYVWADIALVKFRLDAMDYEFYGALERAARLGPWEPEVQLAIADIGLAGWPLLASAARQLVVETMRRASPRQEPALHRLFAAHTGARTFCAGSAAADPAVRRLCRQN